MKKFHNLPFFKFRNGRNVASLWASKIFENRQIKRFIGINLLGLVVFNGIVSPAATNLLSLADVEAKVDSTEISQDVDTKTTFVTPLVDFKISQFFSFWHPGVDLTTNLGAPVYAIDEGVVESAGYSIFGYGKNVLISHPHNMKSLYAHLSEISIVTGRKISRGELIGHVGSTGWSTGNHLHLEIYQNNIPLNPIEVLPLKKEDIKLDGILSQSSPSASFNPSENQVK